MPPARLDHADTAWLPLLHTLIGEILPRDVHSKSSLVFPHSRIPLLAHVAQDTVLAELPQAR
jgi:hypothetical protein